MRLGLIVYLTCVFSTADAGPLQITQAANEDFVAQVHGMPGVRIDELALEIDRTRLVTPWKIGPWQRYGEPVAVTMCRARSTGSAPTSSASFTTKTSGPAYFPSSPSSWTA